MLIVGLDLSTKCTGWAVFEDKKLIDSGRIKPKTTLSTLNKIKYVSNELHEALVPYSVDADKFIIEDIYLGGFKGKNQVAGFATLARLCGAVLENLWSSLKINPDTKIELISAVSARPKVGLKGSCQKAEVQLLVLQTFTDIDTSDYESLIEAVQAKKSCKDIDHKEYKKRMLEISRLIEAETGYGEDVSDAILLAYGGFNK